MEYAYQYTAKTTRGQQISGVVHAQSKALAFSRLKKGGFMPLVVKSDPMQTVSGWLHPNFNATELSRFYITLGRRLKNGRSLVDGLESAMEYVQDSRLRQAIMMMRQSILDGQSEFKAMQVAGFPRRDTLVIRSTAETGRTGDSFAALGDEISRVEALRRSMTATFRMPIIMAVLMVIFVWAALVFIAPETLNFLKQTGLKIKFSPLLENYFKLVKVFNSQVVFFSGVYFAAFFAAVKFVRSQHFKNFLDKFKTLRMLSLKSDHATLWNSFCLLYDAAVPAKEAALIVGESAKRNDSKEAFKKLSKLIESGRSIDEAVTSAGFPHFVVSGVASSASGGDMVSGLTDMVKNFEEDVRMLTSVLQENAKVFSVLGMGVGVLVVFVMTYYPMVASIMSNL